MSPSDRRGCESLTCGETAACSLTSQLGYSALSVHTVAETVGSEGSGVGELFTANQA